MKFEEIMQQWHNHRRGDPGGRPKPGAKQLASVSWKDASCFAPGTGDHQGRPYGLFHRRMYSFNLIIGAGLDQSRPYILSGFA